VCGQQVQWPFSRDELANIQHDLAAAQAQFLANQVALRPKLIEVVPELPKSAAGKVQRIKLHERLRPRQDAA